MITLSIFIVWYIAGAQYIHLKKGRGGNILKTATLVLEGILALRVAGLVSFGPSYLRCHDSKNK